MSRRRSLRQPAVGVFLLGMTACATAAPPLAAPGDIVALEAAAAAQPASADTLTLLGAAYQSAGRHEDAAAALERAIATGDAAPVAHLYLGLASESLERWPAARDAYVAYLDAGSGDDDLRADVRRRLGLVDRALVEQGARDMLAQEDALSSLPPAPRSVAVFPFRVLTDDARFAPLELALADMVTTDLAIPGVLTLVERSQIQAIVREMALDLAGYAEPGTGARVGRLMRAQHVVQGSVTLLPDEQVRLEMALLDATSRQRTGGAANETALERLFDAEKALVFGVLDALGVTLTPAERETIEENRTANLIAFLAYGEGLSALDRGDFAAAADAFGRAGAADPDFEAAQAAERDAAELEIAAETSVDEIAQSAQPELPGGIGGLGDTQLGALSDIVDGTVPNPGAPYTGAGGGPLLAGPGDLDTSNDNDEGSIGQPPSAGIDLGIPNPTRP